MLAEKIVMVVIVVAVVVIADVVRTSSRLEAEE